MPNTTVITDSVACLPHQFVEKYEIDVIPLTFVVGRQIYRDGVDINPDKAYELFLKDPSIFKAAPSSPEGCLEILRQARRKAKNILCITLSEKISTEINILRLAAEKFKKESTDAKIEIIDSETAAAAEGFVALQAAQTAAEGKSLPEVIESALKIKKKVHALVLLDTVRYVYRSGRVPRIAAQAATILNIRPIFTIEGSVKFVTAARSKNAGLSRLMTLMRERIDSHPVHCAVMHAYAPDEAIKLKELISSEFNCSEIWTTEFSPIMGYATGTGTLGAAFYIED
jgi:DegV family protein with EDD domain